MKSEDKSNLKIQINRYSIGEKQITKNTETLNSFVIIIKVAATILDLLERKRNYIAV